MEETERVWAPPRWVFYNKHRPPPGLAWNTLVHETGKPKGEAFYHARISVERQQKLEMDCIANGRLFSTIRHKRMYFIKMDDIIGASSGLETSYLYAEHLACGQVHGRPITADALRKKGANP